MSEWPRLRVVRGGAPEDRCLIERAGTQPFPARRVSRDQPSSLTRFY
ncbi:hypothetical protein ACFPMF_00100 [Larkinella bovis]|uniref:GNAT family N-acetyltransferase n=1 Tax=Larkinella bovis TaxID=683041 RepID=A0ABW0I2F6_9BACT